MKHVRRKTGGSPHAPAHPIAVVAERTGLSQDVLRVWERRYSAVKPARDSNGQRVYTDSDVERLRALHAATRAGRSISQVAGLSDKALASMVQDDTMARAESATVRTARDDVAGMADTALKLAKSLESAQLYDHLRRASTMLGLPDFLSLVAVPFLRQIGDEWHGGRLSPAHEHLASSVLYDILVERMRAFPARPGSPRVLIATPAGERHAIGAAIVGAGAATEGWSVTFLGTDLPAREIAAAAIASKVSVVALSVVYVEHRDRIISELLELRSRLPGTIPLFVGGVGAKGLARELVGAGIRVTDNVAELHDELRRASAA